MSSRGSSRGSSPRSPRSKKAVDPMSTQPLQEMLTTSTTCSELVEQQLAGTKDRGKDLVQALESSFADAERALRSKRDQMRQEIEADVAERILCLEQQRADCTVASRALMTRIAAGEQIVNAMTAGVLTQQRALSNMKTNIEGAVTPPLKPVSHHATLRYSAKLDSVLDEVNQIVFAESLMPTMEGAPEVREGDATHDTLLVQWAASKSNVAGGQYAVEVNEEPYYVGSDTSIVMTGLQASSPVRVKVRSTNQYGQSEWSPTAELKTQAQTLVRFDKSACYHGMMCDEEGDWCSLVDPDRMAADTLAIAIGSLSVCRGTWYWETRILKSQRGQIYFGMYRSSNAPAEARSTASDTGIHTPHKSQDGYVFEGWRGLLWHNGSYTAGTESTLPPPRAGDVVGIAVTVVEPDGGSSRYSPNVERMAEISFFINGKQIHRAFKDVKVSADAPLWPIVGIVATGDEVELTPNTDVPTAY